MRRTGSGMSKCVPCSSAMARSASVLHPVAERLLALRSRRAGSASSAATASSTVPPGTILSARLRIRCRRRRASPSRRWPTRRIQTRSQWSPIGPPHWCACKCSRARIAASWSCCPTTPRRRAAPAMRSGSTCRQACLRCSTISPPQAIAWTIFRQPRAHCSPRLAERGDPALSAADYRRLAGLPGNAAARLTEAWGDAGTDPDVRDGAFRFRARSFGNVHGCLAPGSRPLRRAPRRLSRSGAAAAPRSGRVRPLAAACAGVDAIIHIGAHGTLEWLPGKAVALSPDCFPEIVAGPLPGHLSVHRQQSGRGGAGQAPDRGGDHRPSAAAARRTAGLPGARASSNGWSTNMRRPTGSIAAAASGWRG